VLTRLLKADDICDVGHVDPSLQLETSLSFGIQRRLVFLHHKLRLLLVGIDIFAAEEDALEEVYMILKKCQLPSRYAKMI
jgi:hypothetical protein